MDGDPSQRLLSARPFLLIFLPGRRGSTPNVNQHGSTLPSASFSPTAAGARTPRDNRATGPEWDSWIT